MQDSMSPTAPARHLVADKLDSQPLAQRLHASSTVKQCESNARPGGMRSRQVAAPHFI